MKGIRRVYLITETFQKKVQKKNNFKKVIKIEEI